MSEIISFHAFRRGAGTSCLAASFAALLAVQGKRVCIVDADLQSPSAHIFFDLDDNTIGFTLGDYLKGDCKIEQAVYDVSHNLGKESDGKLYLLPGSTHPLTIMRILREGYEVTSLTNGIAQVIQSFALDYLVLDTCAGITDETLTAMALADTLVLILRLDQQDYQGTAVMFEITEKMGASKLLFVVNDVPGVFDKEEVLRQVSKTYENPPNAIIPHSEDILTLASSGIFSLKYPDHPITKMLTGLVKQATT